MCLQIPGALLRLAGDARQCRGSRLSTRWKTDSTAGFRRGCNDGHGKRVNAF